MYRDPTSNYIKISRREKKIKVSLKRDLNTLHSGKYQVECAQEDVGKY